MLTCTVVLISGYASIAVGVTILAGLLVLIMVVYVFYRRRTKHSRKSEITTLDTNERAHLLEGKVLDCGLFPHCAIQTYPTSDGHNEMRLTIIDLTFYTIDSVSFSRSVTHTVSYSAHQQGKLTITLSSSSWIITCSAVVFFTFYHTNACTRLPQRRSEAIVHAR